MKPQLNNKTIVFTFTLGGSNRTFVRTGNTGRRMSLIHAVLRASDKKYMDIVKTLSGDKPRDKPRKDDIYTNDIIELLARKNGELEIEYKTQLCDYITQFRSHISKGGQSKYSMLINDNDNTIEAYKLIFEMMDLGKLFDLVHCIGDGGKERSFADYRKSIVPILSKAYKKELSKVTATEFSQQRKNYYIDKYEALIREATKVIESRFLYCHNNIVINALSELYGINIYFIDSGNRFPYINEPHSLKKKRKSVIILKIEDDSEEGSRYETIGVVDEKISPSLQKTTVETTVETTEKTTVETTEKTTEETTEKTTEETTEKTTVKRLFDYNDEIIKRIYTVLFYPTKLKKNYPDINAEA